MELGPVVQSHRFKLQFSNSFGTIALVPQAATNNPAEPIFVRPPTASTLSHQTLSRSRSPLI